MTATRIAMAMTDRTTLQQFAKTAKSMADGFK